MLVEEVVADYEGRPAAALFMAGSRVKRYGDEVPLLRDILRHLPHLPTDRVAPLQFLWLVVFGYAPHKFPKIESASHAMDRRDDETAVPDCDIHFVPYRDVNMRQQFLAQAKPLAVAPFLHSRNDRAHLLRLPEV